MTAVKPWPGALLALGLAAICIVIGAATNLGQAAGERDFRQNGSGEGSGTCCSRHRCG